jgi:hypothetical protein
MAEKAKAKKEEIIKNDSKIVAKEVKEKKIESEKVEAKK